MSVMRSENVKKQPEECETGVKKERKKLENIGQGWEMLKEIGKYG